MYEALNSSHFKEGFDFKNLRKMIFFTHKVLYCFQFSAPIYSDLDQKKPRLYRLQFASFNEDSITSSKTLEFVFLKMFSKLMEKLVIKLTFSNMA